MLSLWVNILAEERQTVNLGEYDSPMEKNHTEMAHKASICLPPVGRFSLFLSSLGAEVGTRKEELT